MSVVMQFLNVKHRWSDNHSSYAQSSCAILHATYTQAHTHAEQFQYTGSLASLNNTPAGVYKSGAKKIFADTFFTLDTGFSQHQKPSKKPSNR